MLRNMFAAALYIGIVMNFKLLAWALHRSYVKLGVVHDPGVFRFTSEMFG